MNGINPAAGIVFLLVVFCFVIAGLAIAFGGEGSSDYSYSEPASSQKRRPRVTLEKRRDYDDTTKILKETVTETKIFPEIYPEDLEMEDEDV
jgi:hypothetical protein